MSGRHRPRIGRDHCDALAEILRRSWIAARTDHARDVVELITDRVADLLEHSLGDGFDAVRFADRSTPWELEKHQTKGNNK